MRLLLAMALGALIAAAALHTHPTPPAPTPAPSAAAALFLPVTRDEGIVCEPFMNLLRLDPCPMVIV